MRYQFDFKKTIGTYLSKRGMSVLLPCFILCVLMLSIYGFIAFRDHLNLIDMSKNIIREKSEQDLNGTFGSYFYWSEMVENVRKKNIPFLNSQLEDMKDDYNVVGLSISVKGKTIFSEGVDYPAIKTGSRYVVDENSRLLVGKSFFMEDDEGNIQSDLECTTWIALSRHIDQIKPFLLRLELIPSSQLSPSTAGEQFLGDTRVKTSWIKFLLAVIKENHRVPLFLCLFSILIYEFLVLIIQKYSMQISWTERLRSLSSILEEKDAYTFGHGNRVAEYAVAIALGLNMKKKDIKHIKLAAQCHDLGKIFVPDEILKKKSPLTPAEFQHIKKHSEDSERLFINLIKDRTIGDIIRHHHERWDGKGYPDGLTGNSIPLESRIIAIADTFDAITSQRPYRSAMPLDKALSLLATDTGTHFDPAMMPISIYILEKTYKEEKASLVNYCPSARKKDPLSFLFANID